MATCLEGVHSLGRKLRIRNKMDYERVRDLKGLLDNVYLGASLSNF